MPNWKKVIVSGSDAILNEITSSGGILTSQDIMPDVDNTLSLGSSTRRFQLNGGTPVTVDGTGTTNTVTRFQSATTVEDSTIFSSDSETIITHDNDTNSIFRVSGSNGELLTVTDTIGDTLFQVNDGSGITHFEVSSSGTLVAQNLEYTNETFVLTYNSQSGNINFFSASAIVNYGDSDVTDHINSLGVLSSSLQIATDISGAFTSTSSSIAADIASLQTSVDTITTPVQLTVDCKTLSSGWIPWSAIADLQPNASRAFTTWIAPNDGFLDRVVVSPEQANTSNGNARMNFAKNGTNQGTTQTEAMSATGGTHTTFTFGSTSYSFSAGDRLSIQWDKLSNTADLYNIMVVFRLDN